MDHVTVINRAQTLSLFYEFVDPKSTGSFWQVDTMKFFDMCPPFSYMMRRLNVILARSPRWPGKQDAYVATSPVCVPHCPACASSAHEMCWRNAVVLADIAVEGSSLSGSEPIMYSVVTLNSTFLCGNMVTQDCINLYGMDNCAHNNNYVSAPTPPSWPLFHVPLKTESTSSSSVVAAAVGGAIGGFVLVLLVAAVLVLLYRHRKLKAGSDSSNEGGTAMPFQGLEKWQEALDTSEGTTSLSDCTANATDVGKFGALAQPHSRTSGSSNALCMQSNVSVELYEMSRQIMSSAQDNQLVISAVLGRGGFGTIYSGTWKGLPVAIKSLLFTSDSLHCGVSRKDRVLMEAAISKSVVHPHIVSTFNCDLKPITVDPSPQEGAPGLQVSASAGVMNAWRLYIIQELCDGGSLRDALEGHVLAVHPGQVPELGMDKVLDIATGLASGMVHLHERNIIHGDLNPANVLFKRAGTRLIPKVCDFGFSVHLPELESHVSNAKRGTPCYMAPEVVQQGSLSKAADVYAMGIILWELYMGQVVWRATPSGQVVLQPSFPTLPAGAPREFAGLIAACVHQDPRQRPGFVAILKHLAGMVHDECSTSTECSVEYNAVDQVVPGACQPATLPIVAHVTSPTPGSAEPCPSAPQNLSDGCPTRQDPVGQLRDLPGG